MSKQEMKDVNKRLMEKLVDNKDKKIKEDNRMEELSKRKEKCEQYAEVRIFKKTKNIEIKTRNNNQKEDLNL